MQNEISFNSDLAKYGIGLFETIKVVEGEPVFLTEHLERLYRSIKKLNISFAVKRQVLQREIEEYAKNLDHQALRVTVCEDGYNFSTRDINYQPQDYEQGYDLKLAKIKRGDNPLYKHKTTNYFTNIYVRNQAQSEGYDEALFLNNDNFVLETTMANIFLIKGQRLYTPRTDLNFLAGIMRDKVILSAQELGFEIKERLIAKPELALFDFAFLTNSLLGLMKVSSICGIEFKNSNQIFKQLKQKVKKKEMRS